MRNKKFMIFLMGIFMSLALIAACAPKPAPPPVVPPPPAVIELKMANYFPTPALQSTVLGEFGKEVEERTGGRVKITYYPGGVLLTATKIFEGVVTGIADIGYSHVYYTPGRMPVTEAVGLALGYPSAWVGSQVANDFYYKFKPKEFDDVVVLWMNTSNPNVMITKKPVRKLEDLKGLTIRAPGRIGDTVKALGATPAPTPMIEVYDALAKGVLDGVNTPFETLKTFRFAEVVKYTTASWHTGDLFPFFVVMNKDSYKKLPADVKAIFDAVVGLYRERFILMWNAIDFAGKKFALEKGVEIIELSPEEAARWKAAAEPVIEGYVKEMVAKGYPEAEVRGWIKFLRERIDYWTAKQIEWAIPSPTGPATIRPEALIK